MDDENSIAVPPGRVLRHRGTGTKARLTPEVQLSIIERLRAGIPLRWAAQAAGVTYGSAKTWIDHGNEDRNAGRISIYSDFVYEVERADSEYVASAVARIRMHGTDDWRAEAWLLERMHRGVFGNRQQHEVSGPHEGPIQVQAIRVIGIADDPNPTGNGHDVEPA